MENPFLNMIGAIIGVLLGFRIHEWFERWQSRRKTKRVQLKPGETKEFRLGPKEAIEVEMVVPGPSLIIHDEPEDAVWGEVWGIHRYPTPDRREGFLNEIVEVDTGYIIASELSDAIATALCVRHHGDLRELLEWYDSAGHKAGRTEVRRDGVGGGPICQTSLHNAKRAVMQHNMRVRQRRDLQTRLTEISSTDPDK